MPLGTRMRGLLVIPGTVVAAKEARRTQHGAAGKEHVLQVRHTGVGIHNSLPGIDARLLDSMCACVLAAVPVNDSQKVQQQRLKV